MDVAYDHIQEENYKEEEKDAPKEAQKPSGLSLEVQEAYKALSASPWAAKLGGFWGNVRKQGEQVYETAKQEYTATSKQATTGLASMVTSLTVDDTPEQSSTAAGSSSTAKDLTSTEAKDGTSISEEENPDRAEDLTADIVKEASGMVSRFQSLAAKRLKDIQKAEDAADEALLKFGSNIKNWMRDAVIVTAPVDGEQGGSDSDKMAKGGVLFESKDSEGRRVVHATRFDAQLHVIHSSLDSFLRDPASPEWASWASTFNVSAKTDAIAKDLDKYEELRRAMEKCVPERVEYSTFWKRYYFLRHVVESEEARRREMLKASASAAPDEEIAWDDSDEEDESTTPNPNFNPTINPAASRETLKPTEPAPSTPPTKPSESFDITDTPKPTSDDQLLKPSTAETSPRGSADERDKHSQAGSDASYDIVSGTSSRAPGSPKEVKKAGGTEESDEEDWE